MKRMLSLLMTAALLLCLGACGKKTPAPEPTPEPAAPAVTAPSEEPVPQPPALPSGEPAGQSASAEPSGPATDEPAIPTPTPAPTPEPVPTPIPLTPGTFVGSDGSVLTVQPDGTCTYETTLSGTVNGVHMEGRITFCGTVVDGAFTFTKVMYYKLDVTEIGRQNGYSDYSYWEKAAAVIYAGGV